MLAVLTVRDLHAIEKIHVSKEVISPFGRNDNLIRDSLIYESIIKSKYLRVIERSRDDSLKSILHFGTLI